MHSIMNEPGMLMNMHKAEVVSWFSLDEALSLSVKSHDEHLDSIIWYDNTLYTNETYKSICQVHLRYTDLGTHMYTCDIDMSTTTQNVMIGSLHNQIHVINITLWQRLYNMWVIALAAITLYGGLNARVENDWLSFPLAIPTVKDFELLR